MSDELILVTGGSGFLGSNLIKLLQEKGHRVRTTVRDSKNEKKVKHLTDLCPDAKHKIEVVDADLLDADCWKTAVEGCTYVHHVASPFPIKAPKNDDELIKPAVEGTLNVLKACVGAGTVKRVVLTSSVAAIVGDENKSDVTYTEENWLDLEDKSLGAYNRSKGLAEKAAWDFVNELPDGEKFELATINPGLIIGPVSNSSVGGSINVMQMLLNRQYPALPPISMTCCDVRDVAMAHYNSMTMPEAAGKRFMIVTKTLLFREIGEILDKEFRPQGYNVPTREMPYWMLNIFSLFSGELKTAKKFVTPMAFDNSRMKNVLGINPIDVEKSIIDMGYSVIEKGFVAKTSGFKSRSDATKE